MELSLLRCCSTVYGLQHRYDKAVSVLLTFAQEVSAGRA